MLGFGAFKTSEQREKVRVSERNRFKDEGIVDRIFDLYTEKNQAEFKLSQTRKRINILQKEIGKKRVAERAGMVVDTSEVEKEIKILSEEAAGYKDKFDEVSSVLETSIHQVSNILDPDVPVSRDESGNVTVRTFESKRELKAKQDYSVLMCNFTNAKAGATVVGHRGYYLEGEMALLARALKNYAIDFLREREYRYIQPPVMMRYNVISKATQLSDFSDQLYSVSGDMFLIATSEQPLTALFGGTTLTEADLPKKYAGDSLCFRTEAGAHGKDNAGIFRVHQFEKIEQFVICKPESSPGMLEEMIAISEEFYKSLDISFRVVLVASGELNDAASKKYDLEAYFPVSGKFRELVSASNCTDYLSRNLNIKYGYRDGNDPNQYVHMLNATLCAVQRALCCVVENYQDGDTIVVPEVLIPYTGFTSFKVNTIP